MANNRVCVGGIDIDNKLSVRLLDDNGCHESADICLFNIWEIWDVEYVIHNQRSLPHSEDIRITRKKKSSVLKNEMSMLDFLNKMRFPVSQGDIHTTFEGKLKSTNSGTFYISEDSVPSNSTCFWICDRDIIRKDSFGKIRYRYSDGTRQWGFAFVGLEEDPIPIILQGTLIRLSLAHWWLHDGNKKCFLQLSGWY
ncbi:MAG: hypothetical protein LBJ72_08685 [Dysgonamonadaceae bacterium]|jgi:hypothetical protein|nr:hypothetical protein [Dysgonamonadaceae bacterium]